MTERGDDDLMQGVVRRDPTALMTLYDRHHRLAFALAYHVLGDAAEADEVVQDAFLVVWRRADSFTAARGGGVRAWLLTIVRHRAIDARRRSRRHREALGFEAVEETLATTDAWGEVARRLERDEVRAAVGALPEEQRRAIELAYFEGLTQWEIAERTGTPLGTVKGRLRLGLRKLRGVLAGAQGDGDRPEGRDAAEAPPSSADGCRQGGGDETNGL